MSQIINQLPTTEFTCPGDTYPISKAVHLSRLAAFYPKCRDCKFRNETGQLPTQTIKRLQSTERRVERATLFSAEGVRGVYLNELTRKKAGQMAGALASLLWDDAPLKGRLQAGTRDKRTPRRLGGPTVVVGHDERSSSPDIVTGVALELRMMGCQVIDIGLNTRPCFTFAVDHLQASAGIYVTGTGCEQSWTGLDFVGRQARPFSNNHRLDEIEARFESGYSRPTRQSVPQRTFQAKLPYHAGLWKHFHALRPLRVCVACSSHLVQKLLVELFEPLPCKLQLVPIPWRLRDVTQPNDADVQRVGEAVRKSRSHLGVLIDDDAARCGFLDERGKLVPALNVTGILAGSTLADQPAGCIALDHSALAALQPRVEHLGGHCVDGGHTAADMYAAISQHGAEFGGEGCHYWFREAIPVCDGVVTLAKMLQGLSRSDAAFSRVAERAIDGSRATG